MSVAAWALKVCMRPAAIREDRERDLEGSEGIIVLIKDTHNFSHWFEQIQIIPSVLTLTQTITPCEPNVESWQQTNNHYDDRHDDIMQFRY